MTSSIIVRSRDSLLTTSSGFTNYRGLLNLVIILLLLSNARAALENIIKYGILVDPLSCIRFLVEGSKHWPALLMMSSGICHALISFLLEKSIASLWQRLYPHLRRGTDETSSKPPNSGHSTTSVVGSGGQTLLILAHASIVANLLACITLPPVVVYSCRTHPISASAALMLASIIFLKLVSYHMMNYWCRDLRKPQSLHSKSTINFMRSYAPARVEFGLIDIEKLANEVRLERKAQQSSKSPLNITRTNGILTPASSTEEDSPLKPQLRLRATGVISGKDDRGDNNNNTNNNNNTINDSNVEHKGEEEQLEYAELRLIKKELTRKESISVLSKYPSNLNLNDFILFFLYPTLCYELEFARTQRIRLRFLIKRIVELIILSQLDIALVQQWIVPTVSNSLVSFRQMQLSHMLERLLKLAIPNHVIWIIWFYLFFHSLLNIQAELTRFADREFYRDWWNSESVYYFWSHWNIPVHKWCVRHLYLPSMAVGLSKCQAKAAVFLVSAFFHEYLVSVPLKMFRIWAFTGMLMQLPWARFVSLYFNNNAANVAVWLSLILGQPLCILMYYHDYYVLGG